MSRDGKIDHIRAIAILIVMFGHSIIIYSSNWGYYSSVYSVPTLDCIKQWINMIQMPLFFSLSGALFLTNSKKRSLISIIKNKAIRLMVPYYICAVYMVLIRMLINYSPYAGKSFLDIYFYEIILFRDNGHLWYLPCLFFCFLISKMMETFIYRVKKDHSIFIISIFEMLVLFLISMIAGKLILNGGLLYNVLNYMFFFYFGGFLYSWREKIVELINKSICIFIGVVVILNVGCVFVSIKPINCLVACLDFCALYSVVSGNPNKITTQISRTSFGMYLLHSPLVYITYAYFGDYNPIFVVGLNFLVFGALSYFMTLLILRTKAAFVVGS